jgi:thiol-disulfide isomerase/thioredoxin
MAEDAVTRERFAHGMTYAEHLAAITKNREQFEANERDLVLDEAQLVPFRALERPLLVLVITEDWCGDCVANVPIVARLARETGKLDLRLFLRDQNPDLMDRYLSQGTFRSIPVVVFFDDDFREVGRFIERPRSVTELRARRRAEIYASDPAFGSPDDPPDRLPEDVRLRLQQKLRKMREETKEFADREVVRELGGIVSRVTVR